MAGQGLVPKQIVDSTGRSTVVWVRPDDASRLNNIKGTVSDLPPGAGAGAAKTDDKIDALHLRDTVIRARHTGNVAEALYTSGYRCENLPLGDFDGQMIALEEMEGLIDTDGLDSMTAEMARVGFFRDPELQSVYPGPEDEYVDAIQHDLTELMNTPYGEDMNTMASGLYEEGYRVPAEHGREDQESRIYDIIERSDQKSILDGSEDVGLHRLAEDLYRGGVAKTG